MSRGRGGRQRNNKQGRRKSAMSKEDAKRIQSHADRTNTNQDFKARAMRAAEDSEKDH